MFGLSFGKLLLFAAVVFVVWFGWRRLSAAGEALRRRAAPDMPERPAATRKGGDETVDLVRNPKTGRYEPAERD